MQVPDTYVVTGDSALNRCSSLEAGLVVVHHPFERCDSALNRCSSLEAKVFLDIDQNTMGDSALNRCSSLEAHY